MGYVSTRAPVLEALQAAAGCGIVKYKTIPRPIFPSLSYRRTFRMLVSSSAEPKCTIATSVIWKWHAIVLRTVVAARPESSTAVARDDSPQSHIVAELGVALRAVGTSKGTWRLSRQQEQHGRCCWSSCSHRYQVRLRCTRCSPALRSAGPVKFQSRSQAVRTTWLVASPLSVLLS